ncbi:unnamed protein product, partial [Mesorhabditis belari]|uniref:Uncharacterized protein n=1 Tax=Mesorhabditis belari TaxID=2138241 RepID=A0AAF3F105_9BILA
MRENAEPRRRRDSGSSSSSERESRRRARQSSTVTLRRGYSPFLFKKDQQQDAHHHNHLWFLALIGCLLLPSPLGEKGSTTGVSLKYTPPSPEEMFFSPDYSDEHFFDAFKTTRPLGIRWRGDAEYLAQRNRRREVTLMPVLVQQPPNIQHHRQHLPSTSRSDSEPSLEEIELIDVLWRSDLSGISEKGTVLEQQEETDLAALTHKSITGVSLIFC